MTRRRQDLLTWVVALGLLISQATPWVPEKPYIIAAASGLLGLIPIRKVQDLIDRDQKDQKNQAVEP